MNENPMYESIMIFLFHSIGKPSKRTEILFNIDPLEIEGGQPLFNGTFDTRIRAALRMDDWKLITGFSGRLWLLVLF